MKVLGHATQNSSEEKSKKLEALLPKAKISPGQSRSSDSKVKTEAAVVESQRQQCKGKRRFPQRRNRMNRQGSNSSVSTDEDLPELLVRTFSSSSSESSSVVGSAAEHSSKQYKVNEQI